MKKQFEITLFLTRKDEDNNQITYTYITEVGAMYGADYIAQSLKDRQFITYHHKTGKGRTLINVDHISEISIMPVE